MKTQNRLTNGHTDSPLLVGLGAKMMSKMGWTTGKGLGKNCQGRVNIVEASKQRGRRGLGLKLQGLEPDDTPWDTDKEKERVEESVLWMPECLEDPPLLEELQVGKRVGNKKKTIDDETFFCDADILQEILNSKSVFDNLEPEEMRKARTRSNPFETIRGGMFLNRAAMKMANMDSCFDFMFTNPTNQEGISVIGPNDLLYFADVCAGPGGFSEYVLWKKGWECKGFGFTLRGPNDFKLDEFFAGSPETFEPHYGRNGIEGDGDVYSPDNLKQFQQFVLTNTDNQGVHFMMADGGFSVDGEENIQEILSKRLYLCQFLCALMIVRTGGHFVCKLFDLFTPFSVGLVYLMYRAFEKVCIHKPNTSRPANSERYIVCKWKKEDIGGICDYMFALNVELGQHSSVMKQSDILEIVPLDVLSADEEFYKYIISSNNDIGSRQIIHLNKIRAFARNPDLHETNQGDFRKRCLQAWQVPDKARSAPNRPDPGVKFKTLLSGDNLTHLNSAPTNLNEENLKDLDKIFNYKCVVCGDLASNSYRGFFLSLGRSYIYRLESPSMKWKKLEETLELPADTLFYGELIYELKGEGKAQRRMMSLQIIDALFLGSKDVRGLHYEDRMRFAGKLVKAATKTSRPDYIPLKIKKFYSLTDIDQILEKMVMKQVKGRSIPRLCFETDDDRHILPSGVMIFDTVEYPWITAYSRTQRKMYYFNTKKNQSLFERVNDSAAKFVSSYSKRLFWNWEDSVPFSSNERIDCKKVNTVHSSKVLQFVHQKYISIVGPTA